MVNQGYEEDYKKAYEEQSAKLEGAFVPAEIQDLQWMILFVQICFMQIKVD